jgi:hypothetical protein
MIQVGIDDVGGCRMCVVVWDNLVYMFKWDVVDEISVWGIADDCIGWCGW